MATQTQASLSTAAPPPSFHVIREQRPKPQLKSLPVGRDSHGRSPFLLSLQSPHATYKKASPKPSSPAAQLLESITPRLTWKPAASPRSQSSIGVEEKTAMESPLPLEKKREELVSHLERCLQAGGGQDKKEVLSMSKEGGQPIGCESSVACVDSPTARALYRAFPQSFPIRYPQPEAVFSALQSRKADRALLPVENSLDGTVHRTYDLLLRYRLHIVGELIQSQNLQVPVISCTDVDTVTSRFWVLARDPIFPRDERCFTTTVALVLSDGLGALHKVMAAFAFRGIEVTKVESRPWRQQPLRAGSVGQEGVSYFQYVVYIDFQGSTASRSAQNALSQLQEHSSFMRVLGSYPTFHTCMTKQTGPRTPLASPTPIFVTA